MKTKLSQPNPSASLYRSKRHQKQKDAAIPGIKRKKKKSYLKKDARKGPCTKGLDTKEKGSPNSLKSKEKASGSGAHKANGQRVSTEEVEGN